MRARLRRLRWRKVLVCGFLGYMGLILLLQEINVVRLHRELSQLRQQVRAAHEYNAALYRRIRMMSSDAYIEQVAREQLGMTRPDEIPFLPVPGESQR